VSIRTIRPPYPFPYVVTVHSRLMSALFSALPSMPLYIHHQSLAPSLCRRLAFLRSLLPQAPLCCVCRPVLPRVPASHLHDDSMMATALPTAYRFVFWASFVLRTGLHSHAVPTTPTHLSVSRRWVDFGLCRCYSMLSLLFPFGCNKLLRLYNLVHFLGIA
jgi:hypothetical protein